MPTWLVVLAAVLLTLSLIIGVPMAGAAGRRRGRRLAHPEAFLKARDKAKDTALFLVAMLPSLLVWLAVMGVSFIGLTGFARSVLEWDHWSNLLVPLSLDGISVSFGAWAFVAVKRGRHPGRAYKIVLAAATMSAMLNFVYGRETWSVWAGAYLAFLSIAGMAMFHELLDQFTAGYEDEKELKSRYPRFGQRWLYAPFSTFAARRAWIVHPPREPLNPTVRNALLHAEHVRESRRQERLSGAMWVREEQQAKLTEVLARNEVRAARRGEAIEPPMWTPELTDPGMQPELPPEPPAVVPAARSRSTSPATKVASPRVTAAVTPTASTRSPKASDAETKAGLADAQVEAKAKGSDSDSKAMPAKKVTKRVAKDAAAPEPPTQMGRAELRHRVLEALEAHVRPGDDLAVPRLTDVVLQTMSTPASRETLSKLIANWVDDIQLGVRPHPNGSGLSSVVPAPISPPSKAQYPYEVLALHQVKIGTNVVSCPACSAEAALLFAGHHSRRPVEARCGCGERWTIVGLGSTRVWDALAGELAAGRATML